MIKSHKVLCASLCVEYVFSSMKKGCALFYVIAFSLRQSMHWRTLKSFYYTRIFGLANGEIDDSTAPRFLRFSTLGLSIAIFSCVCDACFDALGHFCVSIMCQIKTFLPDVKWAFIKYCCTLCMNALEYHAQNLCQTSVRIVHRLCDRCLCYC